MIEWRLIQKTARNPQPIKALDISSHSLIRKYYYEREDQGLE